MKQTRDTDVAPASGLKVGALGNLFGVKLSHGRLARRRVVTAAASVSSADVGQADELPPLFSNFSFFLIFFFGMNSHRGEPIPLSLNSQGRVEPLLFYSCPDL